MYFRPLKSSDINYEFINLINTFTNNPVNINIEYLKQKFNLFKNDYFITYIVEIKEHIVATGKIIYEPKFHNNLKFVAHIEDIVVSKEFRKQNIGYFLIMSLLDEINKRNDVYKIILACNEELVPFYEKNNFKVKGVEMCIYTNK